MHAYTRPLANLIEEFAKLPGVGTKTAERMAFHMLKASTDEALKLASAIHDLKTKTQSCTICYNICESSPWSVTRGTISSTTCSASRFRVSSCPPSKKASAT